MVVVTLLLHLLPMWSFGGGNGLDNLPDGRPNPGANVGYKNYTVYEQVAEEWVAKDDPAYDTKEERTAGNSAITYGTGQASINVFGGTIHRVMCARRLSPCWTRTANVTSA